MRRIKSLISSFFRLNPKDAVTSLQAVRLREATAEIRRPDTGDSFVFDVADERTHRPARFRSFLSKVVKG